MNRTITLLVTAASLLSPAGARAHAVPGKGLVPAPGSCSPQWCDVRAFGAKGDGRDDTPAFHAAMSAGRRVYVPAGTYRVNLDLAAVREPGGLILMGDGYGSGTNGTVLRAFDETRPVIRGEFTSSSILRKLQFRDLVISQTGGGGTGNDGFRFRYVYEVSYENVYVVNPGGWCVRLEHCVGHTFINCQFYKGAARTGRGGLLAIAESNLLNVIGGRFTGSGTSDTSPAFQLGHVAGARLFGCSVESWGTGVFLDPADGKVVDVSIDSYFEVNNDADVRVGRTGSSEAVVGVQIRGTFAGPVSRKGHAVELGGTSVRAVTFAGSYVTNREAVIDVSDDVLVEGVRVEPMEHHGLPVMVGRPRTGITILTDGTAP